MFGSASVLLDEWDELENDCFAEEFGKDRRVSQNELVRFYHQTVLQVIGESLDNLLLLFLVLLVELPLIIFNVDADLLSQTCADVVLLHETTNHSHLLFHDIVLHVNVLQDVA